MQTDTEDYDYDEEHEFEAENTEKVIQPKLFKPEIVDNVFREKDTTSSVVENKEAQIAKVPISSVLTEEEISQVGIDEIVIGLGFEDRAPVSTQRLLEIVKPASAHLLYYPDVPGWGTEIETLIGQSIKDVSKTSYNEIESKDVKLKGKNILVDITGLAKPLIFQSIRSALRLNKNVYICVTGAENYYPQDSDIQKVFEADKNVDSFELIEKLSEILVSGEEGRYDCKPQLQSDSDESRRRVLCAFASAKHERLLTLLDERDYDQIEIVVPADDSPKSKIAKLVAEVAASNYPNAGITEVDSHNLSNILTYLVDRYNDLYILKGYNFEVALSGSKLQTVACAALSVAYKLSQCWYVRPLSYDLDKFTQGTSNTRFFRVSMSE